MDRKRRIYKLIESYVNQHNKLSFEEFYGSGAKVCVKNITYVTASKALLLEANVILGDKIDEFSLEPVLAEFLLENALYYLYSRDYKYTFLITFNI